MNIRSNVLLLGRKGRGGGGEGEKATSVTSMHYSLFYFYFCYQHCVTVSTHTHRQTHTPSTVNGVVVTEMSADKRTLSFSNIGSSLSLFPVIGLNPKPYTTLSFSTAVQPCVAACSCRRSKVTDTCGFVVTHAPKR